MSVMLFLCLFTLLFPPRFGDFGDVASIVSLAILACGILSLGPMPRLVKRVTVVGCSAFTFLGLYALVLAWLNRPFDPYYGLRFGRILVHFLGCVYLMRFYLRRYGQELGRRLLTHMFWAIGIHAVVMLSMYVIPSVRLFIGQLTVEPTHQSYAAMVTSGKRIGGLVASLDGLSVVQSFGLLLFAVIVLFAGTGRSLAMAVVVPLILISVVISGRTGMILLIVYLPFMLLFYRARLARSVIYVVMGLIGGVALFYFVSPGYSVEERFSGELERLEFLVGSYEPGGGASRGAVAKLISDYRDDWPEEMDVLILGSGSSSRYTNFRAADPGYILDVYGVGIVGSLVMVGCYLGAVVLVWRFRAVDRYVAMPALLFLFASLLVNGKVRFLYARVGMPIAVYLLFALLLETCALRGVVAEMPCYGQQHAGSLGGAGVYRCGVFTNRGVGRNVR